MREPSENLAQPVDDEKPLAVLATGTRHGLSPAWVPVIRERFAAIGPIDALIHGDAPGIDTIAARIAEELGCPRIVAFPANWTGEGNGAGPIRNRKMLEKLLALRDDEGYRIRVEAFHSDFWDSRGTRNMATIALDAAERFGEPFPVTLTGPLGNVELTNWIMRGKKGPEE